MMNEYAIGRIRDRNRRRREENEPYIYAHGTQSILDDVDRLLAEVEWRGDVIAGRRSGRYTAEQTRAMGQAIGDYAFDRASEGRGLALGAASEAALRKGLARMCEVSAPDAPPCNRYAHFAAPGDKTCLCGANDLTPDEERCIAENLIGWKCGYPKDHPYHREDLIGKPDCHQNHLYLDPARHFHCFENNLAAIIHWKDCKRCCNCGAAR